MVVLNTIATAEGTIQLAMENTTRTIHGSNILIMGVGRVGKVLAKMLDGIGAKVSCEARKNSDITWIKAYGYNPIHLSELDENLKNYDLIINTIPFQILDENRLKNVKKECTILDLSSNPGGVDRAAARKLGFTEEQYKQGLLTPFIGNTYSGATPLGLSSVLDIAEPGDKIFAVSYGSGAGSDAFTIKVNKRIKEVQSKAKTIEELQNNLTYVDYATYAKFKGKIKMD